MKRTAWLIGAVCVVLAAMTAAAQTQRVIPRPAAPAGPPKPEDGSAAPDGYAPSPEWLGQTRAPKPAGRILGEASESAQGPNALLRLRASGSKLAEREGFEPSVELPPQRFSRPPRSTAPAPLRTSLKKV